MNAEGAKKGTHSLTDIGIHSLDAHRLQVTLQHPNPYFLEMASFCVFYPVNSEIDHSNPDWDRKASQKFICSGPFTLKEWKHNNSILLEKNPHYHKADETHLEQIFLSIVESETTALQMFEKGQIDILGQPMLPLPSEAINDLIQSGLLQVTPIPASTFCSFNVDCFPFNNSNIRKAFSYAINRKQIVNNVTQLSENPATSIIPPILKNSTLTHKLFQDANTAAACAYFQKGCKELGITPEEFPKIRYTYSTSEAHHKIAQVLQQQWFEALGVHVELENVEKKNLLHLLTTRNYQFAQCFWMAQYRDPMNILERFKFKDNVKNYPNWETPLYTDLINRSCTVKSQQERFSLLEEAEKILVDEMPITPIFHWNAAYVAKPWVKSQGTISIGNGFFERVWIDKELKTASQ